MDTPCELSPRRLTLTRGETTIRQMRHRRQTAGNFGGVQAGPQFFLLSRTRFSASAYRRAASW
jgi:hypothetical protein